MNVSLHMMSDSPPASPEQSGSVLIDSHGRTIKDLRLSVTDRCNFRCVYCMEPDVKYLPKMDLLSIEHYVRVVKVAMSLGIDKLRITGGEPTLYPHLDEFIERVGLLGLRDVALTTNGSRLTREMCDRWKQMGLHRITVSLDTLRPERKDAITRSFTPLDTVIRAIDMARDAGLTPVKVNAVVMRGVNDDELQEFADFAIEHDVDIRLIEFMALDAGRNWSMDKVVPASEMLEVISRKHSMIKEDDSPPTTSPRQKSLKTHGSTQNLQKLTWLATQSIQSGFFIITARTFELCRALVFLLTLQDSLSKSVSQLSRMNHSSSSLKTIVQSSIG